MKRSITIVSLLIPIRFFAGTGHAKDMHLAYILFLLTLGLILLIWNGFEYISKNKNRISSALSHFINESKGLFKRKSKEEFSDVFF